MIRRQECARRHAAPEYSHARTLSRFEGSGYRAVRIRSVAQSGAVSAEASIWIASFLLAILGLGKAVYSEQPLLWLAVGLLPLRSPPRCLSSSVRDSISEMGCWSSAGGAVDFRFRGMRLAAGHSWADSGVQSRDVHPPKKL
jgi:hypothetical protein